MDNKAELTKEQAESVEEADIVTENDYTGEDWYKALILDCKSIVTEHEFTARWSIVEGYHLLGKRILEEREKVDSVYGKQLLESIAQEVGKSLVTIHKAKQFYEKFPDLEVAPFGKDVSWYKITKEYLPEPKKEEPKKEEKEKVEFEANKDSGEDAPIPAPDVKMVYNIQTELWEINISRSDLKHVDIQYLQKQLDDYIHSTTE